LDRKKKLLNFAALLIGKGNWIGRKRGCRKEGLHCGVLEKKIKIIG
jgi:hypothetical protein